MEQRYDFLLVSCLSLFDWHIDRSKVRRERRYS